MRAAGTNELQVPRQLSLEHPQGETKPVKGVHQSVPASRCTSDLQQLTTQPAVEESSREGGPVGFEPCKVEPTRRRATTRGEGLYQVSGNSQ